MTNGSFVHTFSIQIFSLLSSRILGRWGDFLGGAASRSVSAGSVAGDWRLGTGGRSGPHNHGPSGGPLDRATHLTSSASRLEEEKGDSHLLPGIPQGYLEHDPLSEFLTRRGAAGVG